MSRLRKRPDPATARGISEALRQGFANLHARDDDEMHRLIAQMKDFEGTRGEDDGVQVQPPKPE